MKEITHGDVAACSCGAGKPDVTQHFGVRGGAFYWVSCHSCENAEGGLDEGSVVAAWNGSVAAALAGAVA